MGEAAERYYIEISVANLIFTVFDNDMKAISLNKPVWTKDLLSGKKMCSMSLMHNGFGQIYTEMAEGYNTTSEIRSSYGQLIAHEEFFIDSLKNSLEGVYIKTNLGFRNGSFGELLRLISIMVMKENKLKSINITSLPEAANFHFKYKFKPNVNEDFNAILILDFISQYDKTSELCHLAKKAGNLLLEMEKSKIDKNLMFSEANKIITEFFLRTKGNPIKKAPTIQMQLTDDTINENKDFFNNLFIKHRIDYTI